VRLPLSSGVAAAAVYMTLVRYTVAAFVCMDLKPGLTVNT
jgi:hypothetical protein